jgi:hypothetical protein
VQTDIQNAIGTAFSDQIADITMAETALAAALADTATLATTAAKALNDLRNNEAAVITLVGQVLSLYGDLAAAVKEASEPIEAVARFAMSPPLQSAPAGEPIFQVTDSTTFNLAVEVRKLIDPTNPSSFQTPPTFQVVAELDDFLLVLFPFLQFLTLHVLKVTVTVKPPAPATVDIDIPADGITFGEALNFVKALSSLVPFLGGKAGVVIVVDAVSVRAGYKVALPPVTCGAFTLSGMSVSAALEFPYRDSAMRARFAFAERDDPFVIAAGIYGGGGFFAVSLGPDGVERLEAALEFGATASIDVPGVDGEAHIMAGIYYSHDARRAVLSGFFRAGGHFHVVGLIDLSIDFYLGLTWSSGSSVEGDATLHIEIGMAFFTVSVDLHCHRSFAGGGSGALMAEDAKARVAAIAPCAGKNALHGSTTPSIYDASTWRAYRAMFPW